MYSLVKLPRNWGSLVLTRPDAELLKVVNNVTKALFSKLGVLVCETSGGADLGAVQRHGVVAAELLVQVWGQW